MPWTQGGASAGLTAGLGSDRSRSLHSPVASGAQRAESSRGKTTLKALTAWPHWEVQCLWAPRRHLASGGLCFHLLGSQELCVFEAYAEFPVVLISGVAPRWPSAGLRAPQEAVSTPPQLPTALWHSLGRVFITNCSDEGASPRQQSQRPQNSHLWKEPSGLAKLLGKESKAYVCVRTTQPEASVNSFPQIVSESGA